MRSYWILGFLFLVFLVSVKGQPPLDVTPPITVQLMITSSTLGEGTIFSVEKKPAALTVIISAAEAVDLGKVLPAILANIVSSEVREQLNGSQFQDNYYNFYVNFGNSLSFDDLFGHHSSKHSGNFLQYLLSKFDAAAGPVFQGNPLASKFLEIRQRFMDVLSADELVGLFNGRYLRSFHQKARQVVAEVLVGRPEAQALITALTSIELAVGAAQLYIVKFLEILLRVQLFSKPSHHTNDIRQKYYY